VLGSVAVAVAVVDEETTMDSQGQVEVDGSLSYQK
jgi:hypothetical protein